MSHIRNVGLQRISYSNKPGACQAQKRCRKSPHNFTKRRTPFWGPKNGPRLGVRFLCWHCALFLFQYGAQKRGPFFHLKIGVSFCCFSVVAIALLRLRGSSIFIRISNSGRPTVLTVGSWFVVWLLNNRPALHTGSIRFTYPALKVVLKPISWNHQKALFGPKTTSALWPRWT